MAPRGRSGSGSGLRSPALGLVALALATAAVAELAVVLLAPDAGPEPVAVQAARWFDPAATAAARDYQSGQLTLFWIGFGVELVALGALALGYPRPVRGLLDRLGRRPVRGAALAGAGISLLLAVLAVPTGLIAHDRSVDVGLATQDLGGWFGDRARGAAIAAVLAAIGAAILIALQRRLPRHWWLPATAIVIGYAIVSTWLAPVVLAPIFNDFEKLPPGPARRVVLDLADRAGVPVGDVYEVDASRRSTAINAYVDGIGSSRRIVLYDTLLDRADRPVLRAVVAHELGHVAHHDLRRGLIFVAIVAPLGMLLVARAGSALAGRAGTRVGTPAALPAFVLLIAVVSFALSVAGDQLSRQVEASADSFGLALADDPRGFIELQQRLVAANHSDPDPRGWTAAILGTHPTAVERIGMALAYAKEHGIDPGEPTFPPAR